MSNILAEICATKRAHIARQKAERSFADIEAAAQGASPPRGFVEAIRAAHAAGRYALICEIKRASPSKGIIRTDFDPADLAKAYERGGATCLSVLTDEPYFMGSDDDLRTARAAAGLPVLRKDFILDPYQVVEARAFGADCVLLIMAALSDTQAEELASVAIDWNMDVLIEVHDALELERTATLPGALIGINNRNLKTLKVDIKSTLELAPRVGSSRIAVAESGLSTSEDLAACAAVGVRTFLIGESLMRQPDLTDATRRLAESAA